MWRYLVKLTFSGAKEVIRVVFKNLVITCDSSEPVPRTQIVVDGVDFSDNITEIRFSHRAGYYPSLLLDIELKARKGE